MKKLLTVGVIVLFLSVSVIPSTSTTDVKQIAIPASSGNTLYVGGSGPGNYSKIQDAIDNASDGDTVFVYNGTYQQERIRINKVIKLLGEDKNTTIIDGEFSDVIIRVTSSDITVRGFTLQNCYEDGFGKAIWIWNKSSIINNIYIVDCIIKNCDGGIDYTNIAKILITNCYFHHIRSQTAWGKDSSNVKISKCISRNNGVNWGGGWVTPGTFEFGVFDFDAGCSDVEIFDCTLYDNKGFSICFWSGNNVDVYQNQIYRNSWWGVQFYATAALNNIDFHDNHIYENYHTGVFVSGVTDPGIEIHNNNISANGHAQEFSDGGIYLQSCDDCVTIQDNIISSNDGFGIYPKNGHVIIGNDIERNTEYGIYIPHHEHISVKNNNIRENKEGIYIGYNSNTISGNIISDNECGINLSGNRNVIVNNEISGNEEGIKLQGNQNFVEGNKISSNNFLKNTRDALFRFWYASPRPIDITLNENYWNRARILPKPIFGVLELRRLNLTIPWACFDWHPAKQPNDIDQDYNIPITKHVSCSEGGEESNKVWIEENIISSSNSPPLLVKKVKFY